MSNPLVEVVPAVLPGSAEGYHDDDGPTRRPVVLDRAAHHRTRSNRIPVPERLEGLRTMGWKVGSSRRRDGHFAAYLDRVGGRSWNARNLESATAWCVCSICVMR
jgi:hypothetical protein